ncbi:MAG TPA: RdgB/HAM1 family non-canonical purine NTP pyrophosphatase [Candidatus Deferrimicrobiaceae bacterium]|nr:RdgB/HAM1 family non-canonical purine NTP pyrophosphatase [Candidatus Deferrimicrobiaceae bacterium]
MKLLIATRNRGKAAEIKALIGFVLQKNVEVLTLPDLPSVSEPKEEGKTFMENARIKALHYAKECKILCVADDSGLSVNALGGRPGVRSARYAGPQATDEENNVLLLRELESIPRPWTAAFLCVTAAALPGRVIAEATGAIEGEIIPNPRGGEGFGYDPIFLVKGSGKTMAEHTTEEKNRISHRGQAIRLLVEELKKSGMFG